MTPIGLGHDPIFVLLSLDIVLGKIILNTEPEAAFATIQESDLITHAGKPF